MDTVVGLDLGTSSIKALLVDANGYVLESYEEAYPLMTPHPGWAEQEPGEWWRATQKVLQKLSVEIKHKKAQVLAVGLSGQMNGAVLLDKSLKPIRPCIIWADARTAKQCDEINSKLHIENLISITGKLAVTGYTAPKVMWIREHEPEIYASARHLLLPKDFIRLNLTGQLCTDLSDASNTLLFDINKHEWCDEILEGLELNGSMLPPALPSLTQTGIVTKEAARVTGLTHGTPVIAGAGDSSAEAIGSSIIHDGPVLSVIGTAGNISVTVKKPIIDALGRIHTGCHVLKNCWIMTGVQQAAGLSLRWLSENLQLYRDILITQPNKEPYDILLEHSANVPPGAEGLIFLPYLTGERTPHLDPLARGVFFGIGIRHTRDHFVRAVLEGIAFAQRDAVELLIELGLPARHIVASGGGARSRLMKQILADVIGLPVMINGNDNGAAYGAALLAAVNAGFFKNLEDACGKTVRLYVSAEPQQEFRNRYDALYDSFRDLYKQLKPIFLKTANPYTF